MSQLIQGKPGFAHPSYRAPEVPEAALHLYVKPGVFDEGARVYPTIEAAQQAVRKWIEKGLPLGGVQVTIASGEYPLSQSLEFGAADSGSALRPVVWAAEPGGRVVLHGARKLGASDFSKVEPGDPLYTRLPNPDATRVADLTALGIVCEPLCGGYGLAYRGAHPITEKPYGGAAWPELFYDGKPLTIARYPADDYLLTGDVAPGEEKNEAPHPIAFGYSDARIERWAEPEKAYLQGYFGFDWANAAVRVGQVDKENKRITTAEPIGLGVRPGKRYYFFNVPEELSQPGQWYHDGDTGRVYMIAPGGEQCPDIRLTLLKDPAVKLDGAEHLYLRGLKFAYLRGTAVVIMGGDSVRVEGCEFYNIGFSAIRIGNVGKSYEQDVNGSGGFHHLIRSCDIHDIGFGGISIAAGDRDTLTPCNIQVRNCEIRDYARVGKCYFFAVRLASVGAIVANNRFHAGPHSAIWFGGNDNVMEHNEFYDLLRESDDAAAIYCGRDYTLGGNIVRYNFFHSMKSNAETGVSIFGTYCDDNSANLAFYGNVYYKMQGVHHSHGGHDILFENNLIVDKCDNSRRGATLSRYHYPRTLEKGGQHWKCLDGAPWDTPMWHLRFPRLSEYLRWDPVTEGAFPHFCNYTKNVFVRHLPFEINFDWDNPKYQNTIENNLFTEEDVGFVDLDNMDLTLREDSRVFTEVPGFQPIPFGEIGLYKDEWRTEMP